MAVTVCKFLGLRDHIISTIDGKLSRALRRHRPRNGLFPQEYRKGYGLKPDYLTVALAYNESRHTMPHQEA